MPSAPYKKFISISGVVKIKIIKSDSWLAPKLPAIKNSRVNPVNLPRPIRNPTTIPDN